jgi:cytochrome c5
MQTVTAKTQLLLSALVVSAAAAVLTVLGCSQQPVARTPADTQPARAGASTQPALAAADTGKGGAQLWAQTCSRCHNLRTPEYFSDAEWDVVCQHMRFRASLTGEEQRQIVAFLKAGN